MSDESDHPDITKFLKHYPHEGEITLQVLKGHLLLEEMLRETFFLLLKNPQVLRGENRASFNCYQIICLVEAMLPKPNTNTDWIWPAAKQLNTLRNDLSHKLVPAEIDKKVASFIRHVRNSDPAVGQEIDRHRAPKELEFSMSVSVLCGIFSKVKDYAASLTQASA